MILALSNNGTGSGSCFRSSEMPGTGSDVIHPGLQGTTIRCPSRRRVFRRPRTGAFSPAAAEPCGGVNLRKFRLTAFRCWCPAAGAPRPESAFF